MYIAIYRLIFLVKEPNAEHDMLKVPDALFIQRLGANDFL